MVYPIICRVSTIQGAGFRNHPQYVRKTIAVWQSKNGDFEPTTVTHKNGESHWYATATATQMVNYHAETP